MIGTVLAVGAVLPPSIDGGPVEVARAVAADRPAWFSAAEYLTGRGHRHLPLAAQMTLAAARRVPDAECDPERHGLWVGSATAGPAVHDSLLEQSWDEGVEGIGPLGAPYFSVNLTGSRVAADLRTLAGSVMCTTPGIAGADALAGALHALARDRVDEATVCLVEVPEGRDHGDPAAAGAVALRLGRAAGTGAGLRVRRGFVPDEDAAGITVLTELGERSRPGTAAVLALPLGTAPTPGAMPATGAAVVHSDSGLPAWAALATAVEAGAPVTVGIVSRAGHWAVVDYIPHDPEGATTMPAESVAATPAIGASPYRTTVDAVATTAPAAAPVATAPTVAAPTGTPAGAAQATPPASPPRLATQALRELGFHAPGAGEWVLVLGASSGFGRATAERLARLGYAVYGVYFGTASQEAAAAEVEARLAALGVEYRMRNLNAASAQTRTEVIEELRGLGAQVRTAVHSLAFGSLLPFAAPIGQAEDADGDAPRLLSERQMTSTMEVMAHSLVWWVRDLHLAGLFADGAQVWAMTSAGDSRVADSYGAVSAAKSALLSHVRQLAVELAPRGVAVNAIRAGVTRTPSFEKIPGSEVLAERTARVNPHGRLTTTADVADLVALGTLSGSTWVTGTVLGADGGEGLVT